MRLIPYAWRGQLAKKILYAHHEGQVAGSAISLRNLLLGLDREQIQPRVALAEDGPARGLFEAIGVPVDVIAMRHFWTVRGPAWYEPGFARNLLALRPNPGLRDYILGQNPDIVHVNEKCLTPAGLEAARAGIPVVMHLRCTYQRTRSRLLAGVSIRMLEKIAARILAISEDEGDGFYGSGKLVVINNSVDMGEAGRSREAREAMRKEMGLGDDELLIGMVGYLSEARGAWDFIQMAGRVKAALPQKKLRFVIVAPIPGRGKAARRLHWHERGASSMHPEDRAWQLAHQAGIGDDLRLTGYRKDALKITAAMDIAVSVNRLAATGRAALEAMAVGVPVVVSAGHSGRSQVVRDGETGFVVAPSDHRAMAEAVAKLVSNPILRKEMGDKGLKHSRLHFDPQVNARRVQTIYEDVLREREPMAQRGIE